MRNLLLWTLVVHRPKLAVKLLANSLGTGRAYIRVAVGCLLLFLPPMTEAALGRLFLNQPKLLSLAPNVFDCAGASQMLRGVFDGAAATQGRDWAALISIHVGDSNEPQTTEPPLCPQPTTICPRI
jgi:hypothetical protein